MLAIPAHNRTGTIADVEHIVILMQENRSFDHYFGPMRGVRGFASASSRPVAYGLDAGAPETRLEELVAVQDCRYGRGRAASLEDLS